MGITLTLSGKVAVDSVRVMTVILNFLEAMRAFKIGAPREPEAWRYVRM